MPKFGVDETIDLHSLLIHLTSLNEKWFPFDGLLLAMLFLYSKLTKCFINKVEFLLMSA